MNDGDGCALLASFAVILLLVSCGTYDAGRDTGLIEGSCNVRAEYAKTATDTLTAARTYPECRDILFPTEDTTDGR